MIEGIPKISVLVITYNQEDVIRRAIDSLLAQKDYIYEICVSDDCSKDKTWDILQEYSSKYPGLFVLNRNEPNVGIFENIEKNWTMPTGDMIYRLSGDDEAGEGYLKAIVKFIEENNIDWKNEMFCIYGDYLVKYPNDDCWTGHNGAIAKHPEDALRLGLRGLISNRSCCYSSLVIRKFVKVSQGKSHIAETAQDRQLQLFSKKNYYIPAIGNIYYAGIGVSVHISEDVFNERMKILPYAAEFLKRNGVMLCKKDKNYILMVLAKKDFLHSRGIKRALKLVKYYLFSRDYRLIYAERKQKKLLRIVRFHIPHNKPIYIK